MCDRLATSNYEKNWKIDNEKKMATKIEVILQHFQLTKLSCSSSIAIATVYTICGV